MPRKQQLTQKDQPALLDATAGLRTAPCVPALREAVKAWRVGGYKGTTDTTRALLDYWFYTDHRLPNGTAFRYHESQKEAIETLIFVWEYEKVRSRIDLLKRYATNVQEIRLPPADDSFPRYCTKMATGSGKTKVMSLATAWQFLNSQRETGATADDYARTFLLVAPNVIVFERLKSDFAGGNIFRADPIIPKEMEIFWDFDCVLRGEGEKAHAAGTLFLTNIQQLYDRTSRTNDEEPEEMTDVLGSRPPAQKLEMTDFAERIGLRAGRLLVMNDEAHHTHDEKSKWNEVIENLHGDRMPLAMQLDYSATPRFSKGAIFPWTISDYPLKQAIIDAVVKRPYKGIAKITEGKSDIASERYKGYLTAGVERWREYREQLAPLQKSPILFVMLNSTDEADEVGDWLRTQYPAEFGGDCTLVIHTDTKGEITKADLDKARDAARRVDDERSPVNAIVSVLMLREGWDVQNVTVVVGLRPYSAKANILPEQTIGRGLRLMFRNLPVKTYAERVDIIGNDAFLAFVDDLDKLEDLGLGTFDLGGEALRIETIMPLADRAEDFDIGIPELSPSLSRKKSLADDIAALETPPPPAPLPIRADDQEARTFRYEGYDIITLEKQFEREYTMPPPQTAQEVIGFYARRIARDLHLPSQFAALAPKVKHFLENQAFGKPVDLNTPEAIRAISTTAAQYVTLTTFVKALRNLTIEEQTPELLTPQRLLSESSPFPWSGLVHEPKHSIFNLIPCDNNFERDFARFLDNAPDVKAFAKLSQSFGISIDYTDTRMNLRLYYPDFVAVDTEGGHWLLETKGREDTDVACKDRAAQGWCDTATTLTGTTWRFIKVPQAEFEKLRPSTLAELQLLAASAPTLFEGSD
jgi:type III restriction enzyme